MSSLPIELIVAWPDFYATVSLSALEGFLLALRSPSFDSSKRSSQALSVLSFPLLLRLMRFDSAKPGSIDVYGCTLAVNLN